MDSGAGQGPQNLFPLRLAAAVAIVVAIAQVLGFFLPNGNFWGVDAYAFFPPTVIALAGIALIAIVVLASLAVERPQPAIVTPAPHPPADAPFWIFPVLSLAGAAVFATFHAAHALLGDGVVLITTLHLDAPEMHPFEPFSLFLEKAAYDLLAPFLSRPGREPYEVAWISSGALSITAGAVFLPATWSVARHLSRRAPGAPNAAGTRALTALVFIALVAQGYVQIFFGYVEVYALMAAAVAVYLVAALRFLDDRRPLWPAAVALAAAIGLHLSAVVLAPSFALLAAEAARDPERRPRLPRDAALSLAALAALPLILVVLGHGYNLGHTMVSLVMSVITRQPEPIPDWFWSWRHVRDLVNGQLLIGPLGMLFFLTVAVGAARTRSSRRLELAFFVALGAGFVGVGLVAGDSTLGYARNWDLLAPSGVALAAASLALLLPMCATFRAARACLVVVAAASAFHTVPWIAVNASADRSLQRFTTLPLELGRVESSVGYWYSLTGDVAAAERWFAKALDRYPGNVRAHAALGELYKRRGEFDRACLAYSAAVELRPESDEYRLLLIDAQVRGGQPAKALPEVERLLRRQPENPRYWTVYGIVLLGVARNDAARRAFDAARRHAPYDMLYRMMINYADLPNGFDRAIDEVWSVLTSGLLVRRRTWVRAARGNGRSLLVIRHRRERRFQRLGIKSLRPG